MSRGFELRITTSIFDRYVMINQLINRQVGNTHELLAGAARQHARSQ